jgi:hypothetical protein
MPSPYPTTAQAIYDRLLADTTLAANLGTYTLKDGTTRPAVAVLAANEAMIPGVSNTGVELVITDIPGYAPQTLIGGEVLPNPTWRIYLVAWGDTAGLQTIAQRVMVLLPGSSAASVEGDAPGEGMGVVDQTVIHWTNPAVVVTP